jgi:predicted site-specific integrase-resolvase
MMISDNILLGDCIMDEQFVSIGKAAKMLGMSIDGLRKWEREGRLIPVRTVTNPRTAPRTFIGAIGSRTYAP